MLLLLNKAVKIVQVLNPQKFSFGRNKDGTCTHSFTLDKTNFKTNYDDTLQLKFGESLYYSCTAAKTFNNLKAFCNSNIMYHDQLYFNLLNGTKYLGIFGNSNPLNLEAIIKNFVKYFYNNYIFDIIQIAFFWLLSFIISQIQSKLNAQTKQQQTSKLRGLFEKIYKFFVWNIVYLFLFKSFLNGWVFTWVELFYLIFHVFIILGISKETTNQNHKILNIQPLYKRKEQRLCRCARVALTRVYESGLRSIERIQKFAERYQTITGQNKENVLVKYNFLQFELLRIVFISLVMIGLQPYVILQTILNLLFLLLYFMGFVLKGMSKITFFFIIQVIVELFIIVAYSGAFLFAQFKLNGKVNGIYIEQRFQQLTVIGIIGVTVCQLIAMLAQLIKTIFNIFQNCNQKKKIKRLRILEIEPQLKPKTPLNLRQFNEAV